MAFKLKGFPKIQGTLSARQRNELGGEALGATQEARRNPDLMSLEEYVESKGEKPKARPSRPAAPIAPSRPAEPTPPVEASRPAEPGYKNIPESMRPPMPNNNNKVEGMTQFEYDAKTALKPVLDARGNMIDKVRTTKKNVGDKIKKKAGDIYDYFTEK
tara:strand:+ start:107 stop:583 length:477 start_codon:yes stop_codon:yes gene_type:complete